MNNLIGTVTNKCYCNGHTECSTKPLQNQVDICAILQRSLKENIYFLFTSYLLIIYFGTGINIGLFDKGAVSLKLYGCH